eukprot:evm.model.scf_422.2 EVM.evm.TU.scf_422.2   scf_422:4328-6696(+)
MRWVPLSGGSVHGDAEAKLATFVQHLCSRADGQKMEQGNTKWVSQCQFMKQTQAEEQEEMGRRGQGLGAGDLDVIVVSLTGVSDHRYLVARNESVVIEGDLKILDVLSKMNFQAVAQVRFEGINYIIGDFLVKVGSVIQNEEIKGFMLDVEYRPLSHIPSGHMLMWEFCQILRNAAQELTAGKLEDISLPDQYSLGNNFTNMHSAVQYALMASVYMKGQSYDEDLE